MFSIYSLICKNPLFNGISSSDFDKMSSCLNVRVKKFSKDDVILAAGDTIQSIGLVLKGRVMVVRNSSDGNTNIITEIGNSEIFGEVLACAEIEHSPVSVIAMEVCEVLFIKYSSILTSCKNACGFHTKLIENMLIIIARRNLMLNQKLEILSKRTTRERLMIYLRLQSNGSKSFCLPFNREELSQYLCVDRSALSNELSKLKAEGIIEYDKNKFTLT